MVGLANTATTGFSFGQTVAPQTGIVSPFNTAPVSSVSTAIVNPLASTTGFNFNPPPSTAAAQTGFGTALGQPGFGLPTATAQPQSGFGLPTATAQPQSGFGLPTAAAQPQSAFGLPTATAQPNSGFGLPTATAQPHSGFGLPTAAAQPQSSFGLPTGIAQPQTGFGLPTAAAQPQSSFGLPTAIAQPQTGFGLPTASAQPQPGFGASIFSNPAAATQPTPAATSVVPGLGTGFNFTTKPPAINAASPFGLTQANTSNALAGGTLFSQAPPSSAVPSLLANTGGGFSFPVATATSQTTTTGFNSGLFPPASSVPPPSIGLGGNAPTSAVGQLSGLGGIPTSSTVTGTDNSLKTDGKSIKESPLPQDIFSTVAEFETYRDSEKKACEENIRQTAAPFHKLVEDAKKLRQHITQLTNQHQQLHTSGRKMKTSVVDQSSNVEMAIRTNATPVSLQGDNKAPELFFLNLVKSFEEKMTFCRTKIDEVDNCSRATQGKEISPEDLKEALKWEHESVKQMAARVYSLHSRLTELHNQANRPSVSKPEMLFKPSIGEDSGAISSRASAVLRPCFSDVSGLFEFQSGQQRAKSISLGVGGGAAPPTLSLNQTSAGSNLFGSLNVFPPTNQTNSIFNKSTTFGGANTTSPFGTGMGMGMFGNANTSAIGTIKPFGKTGTEQEESQRKRRI